MTLIDPAADARLWTDADHLLDASDSELEPTGSDDQDEAPALYYPAVDVWVAEFLAPTYRRHIDGRNRHWCPHWWRHPEAVTRLEALWRAWEHLRLDPATGMSVWFRDHADPHLAVLLDPDGPFKYCTPDRGHTNRLEPLPLEQPPPGLLSPIE